MDEKNEGQKTESERLEELLKTFAELATSELPEEELKTRVASMGAEFILTLKGSDIAPLAKKHGAARSVSDGGDGFSKETMHKWILTWLMPPIGPRGPGRNGAHQALPHSHAEDPDVVELKRQIAEQKAIADRRRANSVQELEAQLRGLRAQNAQVAQHSQPSAQESLSAELAALQAANAGISNVPPHHVNDHANYHQPPHHRSAPGFHANHQLHGSLMGDASRAFHQSGMTYGPSPSPWDPYGQSLYTPPLGHHFGYSHPYPGHSQPPGHHGVPGVQGGPPSYGYRPRRPRVHTMFGPGKDYIGPDYDYKIRSVPGTTYRSKLDKTPSWYNTHMQCEAYTLATYFDLRNMGRQLDADEVLSRRFQCLRLVNSRGDGKWAIPSRIESLLANPGVMSDMDPQALYGVVRVGRLERGLNGDVDEDDSFSGVLGGPSKHL